MSKLQVLVATMHQTDFSLIEKMNIHADVIIANQGDEESVREYQFEGYTAKMITTRTRGVGINRNIALAAADAEIVLFADDDVVYRDGAFGEIVSTFDSIKKADFIAFGADITKDAVVTRKIRLKTQRRRIWNAMQFGAAFLAARRSSIIENNISFSELFGGGCIYGSGEDTMFILSCLRNGLKFYSHEYVLGTSASDNSSWFEGYKEKYFYDKGAWAAAAFPKTKALMKWYFMLRLRKLAQIPLKEQLRQFSAGMRSYPRRQPFSK